MNTNAICNRTHVLFHGALTVNNLKQISHTNLMYLSSPPSSIIYTVKKNYGTLAKSHLCVYKMNYCVFVGECTITELLQ